MRPCKGIINVTNIIFNCEPSIVNYNNIKVTWLYEYIYESYRMDCWANIMGRKTNLNQTFFKRCWKLLEREYPIKFNHKIVAYKNENSHSISFNIYFTQCDIFSY